MVETSAPGAGEAWPCPEDLEFLVVFPWVIPQPKQGWTSDPLLKASVWQQDGALRSVRREQAGLAGPRPLQLAHAGQGWRGPGSRCQEVTPASSL